jgi:molybdopterin-guanine dinucleotide biosynthesis protein A
MGKAPKWQLPLGEQAIITHILTRFEPQVGTLILNGASDALDIYGYTVVRDTVDGFQGPLAGLLAGLRYAKDKGFDWVATCPCDAPFLPTDYVTLLARAINPDSRLCSVATSHGRTHPVFGLWSVTLLETLEDTLANSDLRSIGFWASQLPQPAAHVNFIVNDAIIDPFLNINTPDDWQKAEQALKTRGI